MLNPFEPPNSKLKQEKPSTNHLTPFEIGLYLLIGLAAIALAAWNAWFD